MFDFSIITQWFDQLLRRAGGYGYPCGICPHRHRTDIYGA